MAIQVLICCMLLPPLAGGLPAVFDSRCYPLELIPSFAGAKGPHGPVAHLEFVFAYLHTTGGGPTPQFAPNMPALLVSRR